MSDQDNTADAADAGDAANHVGEPRMVAMPKTSKEMLALIDEFLSTAEEKQRNAVWDVMAAVRGPDFCGSSRLKDISTVPIRNAAFPKTAALVESGMFCGGASFGYEAEFNQAQLREITDKNYDAYDHFHLHAKKAAYALGLLSKEND